MDLWLHVYESSKITWNFIYPLRQYAVDRAGTEALLVGWLASMHESLSFLHNTEFWSLESPDQGRSSFTNSKGPVCFQCDWRRATYTTASHGRRQKRGEMAYVKPFRKDTKPHPRRESPPGCTSHEGTLHSLPRSVGNDVQSTPWVVTKGRASFWGDENV